MIMGEQDTSRPKPPPPGTLLDHALELYELGFRVIPCGDPWSRPPPHINGADDDERLRKWCKTPRIKWKTFQTADISAEQITEWWNRWPFANPAVLTGQQPGGFSLVVVDADSAEASAWLTNGGEVRTTPVQSVTARGRHYWYRTPANLAITNQASPTSKIDLRGAGGYVMAPGTTYGSGERNTWEIAPGWDLSDMDQLPELSSSDLGAIRRFGGEWLPHHQDREPSQPNAEVLVDLGAVRLPHDGSPVLPGGRNNALASLVGSWINRGLAIERILGEARRWNADNPQPLAEAEVMACVVSVLTTHIKRHEGAPRPQTFAHTPANGVEILTWGELAACPPEAPEAFWQDGVLFRGARILIAGPPKIGKSSLVIQLAMAAACGGEFMGVRFARPLRVLWLQAEIHKGFLHQRLARFAADLDAESVALVQANFSLSSRCDLDLLDGPTFDLVDKIVREVAPDLLIIDPIINFSSVDENDNAEVRKLLRLVDVLGERNDCATSLVHHTRKDVTAGSFDAIRGASALRGWFDTGIMLTGQPGDAQAVLSYELRNARAVPPSVLERTDSGRLIPCELTTEEPHEPHDQGRESAEPTVGGKMPRNPPHSKRPQTTELKTTEANKLTAIELLRRKEQLYYQELTNELKRVAKLSERTAQRVISALVTEGRIVPVRVGKATKYSVVSDTSCSSATSSATPPFGPPLHPPMADGG